MRAYYQNEGQMKKKFDMRGIFGRRACAESSMGHKMSWHPCLRLPVLGLLVSLLAALFVPVSGWHSPAQAATDTQETRLTVRGSGLKVPRFVTLKSDEVNMRAGPGLEYPVIWHYRRMGLPLRVEAEFEVWRKVVDHKGDTGWMHQSVVSLRRFALVTDGSARIYLRPSDESPLVAVAERDALMELQSCPTQWCKVASGDTRGWMSRTALWGLLEGEVLK